jgi:hypothetical protein
VRLKNYSCPHRRRGRGQTALAAIVRTASGREHALGSVCERCATGWGLEGLARWGSHILAEVYVWQPALGSVDVVFSSYPGEGLPACTLAALLQRLEVAKFEKARDIAMIGHRAGVPQLDAVELANRVTLSSHRRGSVDETG